MKTYTAYTMLNGELAEIHSNGASAYQVALANGFEGTEEEWLASLKGDKGEDGVTAINDETASAETTYSSNKINEKISALEESLSGVVKRAIVEALPQDSIATDTIYMVLKENGTENNIYDEYMYINSKWELIGSTSVDLSDYYNKDEINEQILDINKSFYGIANKIVVNELPTENIATDVVYFTDNLNDLNAYMYINNQWEVVKTYSDTTEKSHYNGFCYDYSGEGALSYNIPTTKSSYYVGLIDNRSEWYATTYSSEKIEARLSEVEEKIPTTDTIVTEVMNKLTNLEEGEY
jgi:hypothetical protein